VLKLRKTLKVGFGNKSRPGRESGRLPTDYLTREQIIVFFKGNV